MKAAEARALFAQQSQLAGAMSPGEAAVYGGGAGVNEGGLPAPKPRERLQARVDLSPTVPHRYTLTLRNDDDEPVEVHVRVTTGAQHEYEWYGDQSSVVRKQMKACTDLEEFKKLKALYARYQTEISRLMIYDLPEGLLEIQPPDVVMRLQETIDQLISEATGDLADPLGYIREVYEHVGTPEGSGNAAMTTWLASMFDQLLQSPKGEAPTLTES